MVEQQAIGRVVRLGQKRPVVVTRYIMRDTVEEVTSFSFHNMPSTNISLTCFPERSFSPRLEARRGYEWFSGGFS